jgi:triosephosphate isomerase
MIRIPFLAANWKMFKTVQEGVFYAKEFRVLVKDLTDVEIVLAPPFTGVHAVAEACRNSIVAVAGQDMYWEKEGAYTGEVSAPMLKEAGAEYVLVGHSERRRLFDETDETVNRKTLAAFQAGLVPIVCVGETLEEREGGQTLAVLDRQVNRGLDTLTADQVGDLVVAYEPVWAIGTGRNATPEQAGEAHAHIRGRLKQWFGADAADRCHILYGGSVKADNVAALAALPDIDGGLVGGASLETQSFLKIVQNFAGARKQGGSTAAGRRP